MSKFEHHLPREETSSNSAPRSSSFPEAYAQSIVAISIAIGYCHQHRRVNVRRRIGLRRHLRMGAWVLSEGRGLIWRKTVGSGQLDAGARHRKARYKSGSSQEAIGSLNSTLRPFV
jgi:hypothetical protein